MRGSGKGSLIFGFVCAIISSATFGLLPLFTLPAMEAGMGVNSILFYRFSLALALMGVIAYSKGVKLSAGWKELRVMILVSFAYAGTSKFLTLSYLFMPSGIASTVFYFFPIIVAAIMVLFFKEKFSWIVAAASLLALVGVYVLQGSGDIGQIKPIGLVIVFASALCYALYIISLNHTSAHDMNNFKCMFYVFAGALITVTINLIVEDGVHLDPISSWKTGISLLLLGSVPTLFADLLLMRATKTIGSTNAALLSCMEPITAYLVGIFVFGEVFHPLQILGIVIILSSVLLIIFTRSKYSNNQ